MTDKVKALLEKLGEIEDRASAPARKIRQQLRKLGYSLKARAANEPQRIETGRGEAKRVRVTVQIHTGSGKRTQTFFAEPGTEIEIQIHE